MKLEEQNLGWANIQDAVDLLGAQELAAYEVQNERGATTGILVATSVGLFDVRFVEAEERLEGGVRNWSDVRAGLAWTKIGNDAARYRIQVNEETLPLPETGSARLQAWRDFVAAVLPRAGVPRSQSV